MGEEEVVACVGMEDVVGGSGTNVRNGFMPVVAARRITRKRMVSLRILHIFTGRS